MAVAAILALLLAPQFLTPALADPAKPDVRIALSKDAYWYRPGDTVVLQVTLDNKTDETLERVSVRARVHAANKTRSDFDACFQGKPVRSYRLTETLGRNLTLSPGNNGFKFDMSVPSRSFSDGVYPLTVEAIKSDKVIATAISELVVMDLEEAEAEESRPLNLSVVFDLSEPPHRGPDGDFTDDELAGECSTSGKEPGWFSSVVSEAEKWENFHLTFSLSPMIFSEMLDMSDGYVINENGKKRTVGSDSTSASDAARVVTGFQVIAGSPGYQFLSTPFAYPDLETLVSLGWDTDALEQISGGNEVLEEGLESSLDADYFYPPDLNANSKVIGELGEETGEFLLLSPRLLERNAKGKRLIRGLTLSSPVVIEGTGSNRKVLGLFADGRLEKLIGRLGPSGDPHGVAQCILSELTNLYLERPVKPRSCVLLWPNWWRPSSRVFDEVMKALDGAPWLKSATFAESLAEVNALEDVTLEIPGPGSEADSDRYIARVSHARSRYQDYSGIALADNPVLPLLRLNLFSSESDLWRLSGRPAGGVEYAEAVIGTVDAELDKISMPAVGSVTLASGEADVPLSVVNGTSYKVKATLRFSSNGLTFPDGDSLAVILEPKENLFEVPVEAYKEGKVRFSAWLETDRIVLAELDIAVRTSRFNTFAVILVAGLLGLIALIWVFRITTRRKAGKHKKRQLSGAEEEGSELRA